MALNIFSRPAGNPNSDKFNLTGFISNMHKTGIARPAYFAVMITPPTSMMQDNTSSIPRTLMLRIESASLPTRNVLTHDQRYYGPIRRIPYGYLSQDLTITVILSEDMREREFFMRWQDKILGPSRTMGRAGQTIVQHAPFDVGYYDTGTKGAMVQIMTYGTSPSMQGAQNSSRSLFGELQGIAQAVGYDPSMITNPLGLNIFGGAINQDRNIDYAYRASLLEPFPLNIAEVPLSWADDGYARLTIQFSYRYFQEEHATFPDTTRDGSLANLVRGGINSLNRFAPVFSLIKGQGLGGVVNAIGNQILSGGQNVIAAQKTIFPF